MVLNHPASEQISLNTNRAESLRDAAESLRGQIASQLDDSAYQAAWEAAQGRPLAEVVAEILG